MWNLIEASNLIQELNKHIKTFDYHVCLGGSVINNGQSNKDLDLFFLRLNGYQGQRQELINYLFKRWGILHPIRDSPDYHSGEIWYYESMLTTGRDSEKRIDFFIQ